MRFIARMWLFGNFVFMRGWYTLTQILTRKDVKLPVFSSAHEIIDHLDYGNRWKSDPIHGVLDVCNHATKMERRILGTGGIEDCDGHACYWCQALIRSNLSTHTYFCTLLMKMPNGKKSGHVIVAYRDGLIRYWADYSDPAVYVEEWEWATACAARFGAVPLCATMTHVRGVTAGGRVKFGSMSTHLFPEP